MNFQSVLRCGFSSMAAGVRAIPESKGLPMIGTMLAIMAAGGAPKLHLYIDKRHREQGPIFREKIGPVSGVFISDGNYMRKIFAVEGKYPKHIIPESWAFYNEIYGCKRGLLFMDGEEWATFRKSLNNIMLKNNEEEFAKATSVVAKDMIEKWKQGRAVNNLEQQLYRWSLEVIVAILMGSETFEQCKNEVSDDVGNLARIVHQVFIESASLSLMPTKIAMKLNLPVWKRFVNSVGSATSCGKKLLKLIREKADKFPHKKGLLHKISEAGIREENLDRIVTDLILAAGDTTTYTMQWMLHLISVNPDTQTELQEVADRTQESGAVSCSLLKGALKESMRLYPVAPFITRYMPDDIIIDGYNIKAGELVLLSLYTSGRDERYFPDPHSFAPTRWQRSDKGYENVNNPNASLPFAMGSRSCIGKKMAETQMLVTLHHIMKNFTLSTNHKKAIGITLHLISVPEKPIQLILKPRTGS